MKQENKELLLRDLCARLPYGVKVKVIYRAEYPDENDIEGIFILNEIDTRFPKNLYWIGGEQLQEQGISRNVSSFATCSDDDDEIVKPYLFPLSSMTEEQKKEYYSLADDITIKPGHDCRLGIKIHCIKLGISDNPHEEVWDYIDLRALDWLNKNHFDYRGLIEKGLAIDATGLNIY